MTSGGPRDAIRFSVIPLVYLGCLPVCLGNAPMDTVTTLQLVGIVGIFGIGMIAGLLS